MALNQCPDIILDDLSVFRNLVIVSTAIPDSFGGIARGIDEIPRHDWLFYKALLAALPNGMRRPVYGDYTIVHPEFTPMDMRMIKPAGKIVYTTAETWATCKGGAFRDNREQMHDHCKTIVKQPRIPIPWSRLLLWRRLHCQVRRTAGRYE